VRLAAGRRRTGPLVVGLGVTLGLSALQLGAPAEIGAQAPPPATFTANVRADLGLGTGADGDNEPQVAVDQTGKAYVTWQTTLNTPTYVAATTDGRNFSKPAVPDPSSPTWADVGVATTTWPLLGHTKAAAGGETGTFWGDIGQTACGPLEVREATSKDQGATWAPQDAVCDPNQVDRPWIAAYTPAQYRGTPDAVAHTDVFFERHDFTTSNITVTRSIDGGATWNEVPQLAEQPGSFAQAETTCNSIPSGIAFDQRGAHPGRAYLIWETSDLLNNLALGCDYTQAQTFDHLFMSYSDDGGNSWTSQEVFSDPGCAASSAPASAFPNACQDISELFNTLAVDDGGNVWVSFVWRDPSLKSPEYDVYLEKGTPQADGTIAFGKPVRVNQGTGTFYMPWIAAGASGMIDVAFYGTPAVEGVGTLNKPAAAPPSAVWNVYMAQSIDGGQTFTVSRVSDHPNYFGDICSTGIFCGNAAAPSDWGQHRILYDDFGIAIGPDGGARMTWTDARDSWKGACQPGGDVACQTTHVYFACQTSGTGLQGETVTGCGQVAGASGTPAPTLPAAAPLPNTTPAAPALPLLPTAGLALAGAAIATRQGLRRRPPPD